MQVIRLVAPGPLVAMQTAGPAGRTGVAVGHEPASLLVPGEDGPHVFGADEGLVQLHRGSARIGVNGVHALPFKGGYDDVRTLHFGSFLELRLERKNGFRLVLCFACGHDDVG